MKWAFNYAELKYYATYSDEYSLDTQYTPSFEHKKDLLAYLAGIPHIISDTVHLHKNYATFRGLKLYPTSYYHRSWFVCTHYAIDEHKVIGRRAS